MPIKIDIKLRSLIKEELKTLFLEDDKGIQLTNKLDKFLDAETKKTNTDSLEKVKLKAIPTLNPQERTAAEKGLQINKNRVKELSDLKKAVDDKKKELETQQNSILNKSTSQQTTQQTNINPGTNAGNALGGDSLGGNSLGMGISEAMQKQTNMTPQPPVQAPVQQQAPVQHHKTVVVHFDTKTQQPFDVKFSERGFVVGDTRLSFELLETALSKNLNITLENGKGLTLDAIKMQKVLKYKDRF